MDSIRATGLGANPHSSLATLQLLKELMAVGELYFGKDSYWAAERIPIEAMLKQDVTSANLNFRHGTTYLTPSRTTAVRYALSNSHGSELLSCALHLFTRLRAVAPGAAHEIAAHCPQAIALLPRGQEPLLIEVRDVTIRQLRSESGQDALAVLDQMQRTADAFDAGSLDTIWQQFNFELIEALPADRLTFSRIKPLGDDPIFPRFQLESL